MNDCTICKITTFIDETSGWYVDVPSDFSFPGLYFLRLKRHIESLADLTDEESREVGMLIKKFSAKSYEDSHAQRVLALSLGLSDPHIHFWILPKTKENEDDVLLIRQAMGTILSRYRGK